MVRPSFLANPASQSYVDARPVPPGPPVPPKNGTAIIGFLLSLLGLGFLVPLFGILVAPLLLLALVLSILAFRKARRGAPLFGLALAGLVISSIALIGGTILNVVVYRDSMEQWAYCPPAAVAPSGPQASALIGDWARDGNPIFRYHPDGTGSNLTDNECFNWSDDGTFSNALTIQTWHIDGETLTVELITGDTITLQRVTP